MVPVLVPKEKLSPFSVGALEDIGYTVDYGAASDYTYNDLGGSCKCKGRRTLFGQEVEDEEENMMSLRQPERPSPRKLSDEATSYATEAGQKVLALIKAKEAQQRTAGGLQQDEEFVGDQEIHVYMVDDDGQIHSVEVKA